MDLKDQVTTVQGGSCCQSHEPTTSTVTPTKVENNLGVKHVSPCCSHKPKISAVTPQKITPASVSLVTKAPLGGQETNASKVTAEQCSCYDHEAKVDQCSCHDHETKPNHNSKIESNTQGSCCCHAHGTKGSSHAEHQHEDGEIIGGCSSCCGDSHVTSSPSWFDKVLQVFDSGWVAFLVAILLVLSLVLKYNDVALSWLPTIIVSLVCGLPILVSAVKRLAFSQGILRISSSLLVSMAIIAALLIGDYFAAAEVAFIMAIGERLEHWTVKRTQRGIRQLVESAPATARKLVNGVEQEISVTDVVADDILLVRPGEMIPVDGVILQGSASIDASSLTGESVPEVKEVGAQVMSGTISTDGALQIKALRPGTDGALQRIIKIVRDSGHNKANIQTTADKWASILIPMALLIAVATLIFTGEVTRAVAVLVVFCPCALVLATPTAIIAAIGQAAKHGVIIKSGAALERMAATDTAVFDKTGTLSQGRPECTGVILGANYAADELTLLRLVGAAEAQSEHPLARALVRYAQAKGISTWPQVASFGITAGRGIKAMVDGHSVLCGSSTALNENGITLSLAEQQKTDQARSLGQTVIFTAVDGVVAGIFSFADALKDNAKDTLKALQKVGVTPVILSGDHKDSVAAAAKALGVTEFKAGVLPSEKLSFIRELQLKGHRVFMTGDGINDAPALKIADVGVAMGVMGSDLALEASDVALMKDDISKVPYLKLLSKSCANTIKTGIAISLVINLIAVTLSIMGLMTPAIGAVVHNAGSCFVILFASLLYDRKLTV